MRCFTTPKRKDATIATLETFRNPLHLQGTLRLDMTLSKRQFSNVSARKSIVKLTRREDRRKKTARRQRSMSGGWSGRSSTYATSNAEPPSKSGNRSERPRTILAKT